MMLNECKRKCASTPVSDRVSSRSQGLSPDGLRPIPSNRDIDEVAFLTNRQMKAEQRKLPGESKYPVVS
jgi:hypothetical protein